MNDEVRRRLKEAMEDLRVVVHEMALAPEERVAPAICFHAQQFVEKVFKAFLVLHGKEFPRTHNLSFLRELCGEVEADFRELPVGELSLYAVEMRYPGESAEITADDALACFEKATQVKRFIERKLGIRLEEL